MDYGAAAVYLEGDEMTADLMVHVPCTIRLNEWGLQGFAGLGPREGMLFASRRWPVEEAIPMWMARVRFPLAMIWIGADGLVSHVELTQPGDPNTYDHRGLYVVEANADLAHEVGIRPGTPTALSWIDPCPRRRR